MELIVHPNTDRVAALRISPPPIFRSRGKVAGTRKTSEVVNWPNITAAQFDRLPGHEKTALYFATCTHRVWQANWHNNFQLAFDRFRDQLVIRDRERREYQD